MVSNKPHFLWLVEEGDSEGLEGLVCCGYGVAKSQTRLNNNRGKYDSILEKIISCEISNILFYAIAMLKFLFYLFFHLFLNFLKNINSYFLFLSANYKICITCACFPCPFSLGFCLINLSLGRPGLTWWNIGHRCLICLSFILLYFLWSC